MVLSPIESQTVSGNLGTDLVSPNAIAVKNESFRRRPSYQHGPHAMKRWTTYCVNHLRNTKARPNVYRDYVKEWNGGQLVDNRYA